MYCILNMCQALQSTWRALSPGAHTANYNKEIAIPVLQVRKQVRGSKATIPGHQARTLQRQDWNPGRFLSTPRGGPWRSATWWPSPVGKPTIKAGKAQGKCPEGRELYLCPASYKEGTDRR